MINLLLFIELILLFICTFFITVILAITCYCVINDFIKQFLKKLNIKLKQL